MFKRFFPLLLMVPLLMAATVGPVMAQSSSNDISAATKRLFEAVENNDMSAAQISIAGGGDINAVNDWGLTPVDLAVDKGYFKIVHYLLSVREIRKSSPKVAPAVPVDTPPAPPPAPAPVAKVYAPPPGSDPWSATVVTATPTPQPQPKAGPSPFDAARTTPQSLPIIGDVRGRDSVAATDVPETQAAPETQQPGFFESLIDTYIGKPPEQPSPPPPAPKPVKQAIIMAPTPPVSPPGVTGTPPPIEGKLMPDAVENAPLTEMPSDEMQAPRVSPVAIAPTPIEAPEPEPEPDVVPTPKPVRQPAPPPQEIPQPAAAEPIGRTTPPGKPRDDSSWFNNFKSFFSFSDDTEDNKDETAETDNGKSEGGDWRVREIEQAQVIPRPAVKKNQAEIPKRRLDGVILTLGRTTSLGKTPPPQAPAPWFYKSCINKKLSSIIFCIEPLDWPDDIKTKFITDSVMYEGAQTIVRYDEGTATYFHTLFPSTSYPDIVDFFTRRYGPPTKVLNRSIAPLASPRMANPTVIWQSRAPVTNLLTTLEIRLYDDARGGFPDTKRGAVYLYHEWSQPVFPRLSSVELMLLRAEKKTR